MSSPEDLDVCAECGGLCCKAFLDPKLILIDDDKLEDSLDYYRCVGIRVFRHTPGKYYTMLEHKCKYYSDKGCTRFDTRPNVCRGFPHTYIPHLAKHCPLMVKLRENGEL